VTRIFWQRHFEFNQLPKARPARKCRDTGIKNRVLARIGSHWVAQLSHRPFQCRRPFRLRIPRQVTGSGSRSARSSTVERSDVTAVLLREVEKRIGILHQFAACFTDYRNPDLIEH
jgi:hypothetical protein